MNVKKRKKRKLLTESQAQGIATRIQQSLNPVAKYDFNVGGAHQDQRKKTKVKHKKDYRFDA